MTIEKIRERRPEMKDERKKMIQDLKELDKVLEDGIIGGDCFTDTYLRNALKKAIKKLEDGKWDVGEIHTKNS